MKKSSLCIPKLRSLEILLTLAWVVGCFVPLCAQTFSLSNAPVTFQGKHGLSYFGFSTACGDVNGDGLADIAIGAFNATTREEAISTGEVYLFISRGTIFSGIGQIMQFGQTNTISCSNANATFLGKNSFDEAGYALYSGDVNGDGFSDLLVGAPGANKGAGEVYLLLGHEALLGEISLAVASMTLQGERSGDRAGSALTVGDINQDGYADIIIGAPGASENTGKVYVIFGSSSISGIRNLTTADASFMGTASYDEAGSALAIGDVNGDGIGDLCITAPMAEKEAGIIYVNFGKRGLRGATDLSRSECILKGKNAGDQAGTSLACGDVNGDLFSDVVIGAPMVNPGNDPNTGEVYILFGKRDLPLQQTLAFADVVYQGIEKNDQAGIAVATANISPDRLRDVIVGANFAKQEEKEIGEVYFCRSKKNLHGNYNLLFSMLRFRGKAQRSEAGFSLSAGDCNGDGIDDVIVGAYKMPVGDLPDVGEAYLIFGLGL